MNDSYDAAIVGSGPNGLAAAVTLAQKGLKVVVYEAKPTIGGGTRSAELTQPGFIHDICSAIHPLGVGSPFFKDLPLDQFGLEWVYPEACLAHPFENGEAIIIKQSLEESLKELPEIDRKAYRRLMEPLVKDWEIIAQNFLGPFSFPSHPFKMLRFASKALQSAWGLARTSFRDERTRGMFAGLAAHSIMPLKNPTTAAFGVILGLLAHRFGWPMAKGGSQQISEALKSYLISLGGKIFTNHPIHHWEELPKVKASLFDLTPRQFLKIMEGHFPASYTRQLQRYRYGPGVFKIDWAIEGAIPYKNPDCLKAGTIHIGGSLQEITASEKMIWQGKISERPYVLLAQQSLFDRTRAPEGKNAIWAYCHVPNGSTEDMTEIIENQIERVAPGFKERILARHRMNTSEMEAYNPNYVGGDINGGAMTIPQLFTRPAVRLSPYTTPMKGVYICSSATPPGGGVHGMCGYHAAKKVLKKEFGIS